MILQDKEIEIVEVNYDYEFINERECKKITKITLNVPPQIDKYTHSINSTIYDLKVTDNKGVVLPIVDNGKPKRGFQFNIDDEKIKLKSSNITETQVKSITILLSSSSNLSENGSENFEINISYTLFNNAHFNTFFKDSILYKEFLIGKGCNSITEIKVPQQYNIDLKSIKIKTSESEQINQKKIPFSFLLKDSKHVIFESVQHTKTEFVVLTWKIIINKINLNWIRFGFNSWLFVIIFIPLVTFLHPPSATSIVGILGGLLASLLAIRLRNISEISLVERWNNIYIWMLVLIIIESTFLLFVRSSL